MEVQGLYNSALNFEANVLSMVESLVVETALLAQKSLLGFLLVIRSLPDDNIAFTNLVGKDQRFPMAELNKVKEPVAENKNAGESEDNEDDDHDDDEDDDNESGDDSNDDDDDEDSDDDIETNGDGGSDDEDDDEDDSDDDEDDDDEEDDDEDDEEEQPQPPTKKKK
ncbi:phosphopantothenoylcysteine decarboxylase subunit VHS3-like isoform X1 [Ziziphus jujuba]|uniref:Phosphopantothenoylcysteine decarboxylase subunit VHS3-like isoform X1 n=1 Tax=Ziziphus jujuba TaxID=326968 RepID=A0A6P3YZS9_ZIZJJ|nr:phosphopantothenoylcysteine decarboxylase subunit VHS3-like isoform X1 [Ziziphus jujuba]